jgi:hypothetical protein
MATDQGGQRVCALVAIGPLLLAMACNMPLAAEELGDDVLQGPVANPVQPTPGDTPSVDPGMSALNNAIATIAAAGAPIPPVFSCIEKDGNMVSYLDAFPTSPSMEGNSLVAKEFDFTLREVGLSENEVVAAALMLSYPPYSKYALGWDLYFRVLSPVVRTSADGSRELESYIDKEGWEEGTGQGWVFENGLFYGELEMWSESRDDGRVAGESEYVRSVAGVYDPGSTQLGLCISWGLMTDLAVEEILQAGPSGLAAWCRAAEMNYFVCAPGV